MRARISNMISHWKKWPAWLVHAGSFLLLGSFAARAAPPATPAPSPNEQILRAQIFLDGSAFKPGVLDGRWGEFMSKALARYEQAQG